MKDVVLERNVDAEGRRLGASVEEKRATMVCHGILKLLLSHLGESQVGVPFWNHVAYWTWLYGKSLRLEWPLRSAKAVRVAYSRYRDVSLN